MQGLILDEPRTIGEAIREISILRQENEFLKKQIEISQTFQARMGLILNKITISDLFTVKKIQNESNDRSRTVMYHYRYAGEFLTSWAMSRGIEYADEITLDHTYEFWNWLKKQKGKKGKLLTESTRVSFWKLIKATFQYAEDRNNVVKNVWKNKALTLNPVSEWWDDAYYHSVLRAIDTHALKRSVRRRFKTITRCLYTTGLRVSLFLGVKHEDVMLSGDRLFIKTKRKIQKSAETQEITVEIINAKAKKGFLIFYDPNKKGLIFGDSDGTTLASTYRKFLRGTKEYRGICEKAKIPYKSPHKAKHGFITKMLILGYTAEQICKLTGNSDPAVIYKIYNHIKSTDFTERVKIDIEDL